MIFVGLNKLKNLNNIKLAREFMIKIIVACFLERWYTYSVFSENTYSVFSNRENM